MLEDSPGQRNWWSGASVVSRVSFLICMVYLGPPCWLRQERIFQKCRRHGFDSWVGKIPWRREQQPTLVFLPGESHGQRSLVGYIPWSRKESDTTERLILSHFLSHWRNTTKFRVFLFLFPYQDYTSFHHLNFPLQLKETDTMQIWE